MKKIVMIDDHTELMASLGRALGGAVSFWKNAIAP